MRGPIGAKNICLTVGVSEHKTDSVAKHIEAFRAAGLVYVHSYSHYRRAQYAWQPQLFFFPDAVIPAAKRTRKRKLPEVVVKSKPKPAFGPNSVFALGAAV